MKLFVGIDVSKARLDVSFLDSDQHELVQLAVSNDVPGASKIKETILKFQKQTEYERIVIGMEATSIYSFHPSMFFHEDHELKALRAETVVVNPFQIHQYRKAFEEDKTDTVDAYHIADFLRIERYRVPLIKEEEYIALQRLTRTRFKLINQQKEVKQHFLEELYYKCNTLSSELDTSVFGASIMDLLEADLSVDEISQMPLEELTTRLIKSGRGRFGDPEKVAKALQKALRDSYRLGKVLEDSVDIVLGSYAVLIQALKNQIKTVDKAIEHMYMVLPESQSLMSVPGIGPVYTAGLLAEIGQIERFDNESQLAKYAGLYWPQNQSGNFKSEVTSRTKTGNKYLRYYLIEAANSVRHRDEVFNAYFQRKYKEVPKFQSKRALVLTARKLVRVIFVLLHDHLIYTPKGSGPPIND
jgi:transposase